MTDSTRLVTNSQRIAPTRTESVLKVRFVQYGRHRRLTINSFKIIGIKADSWFKVLDIEKIQLGKSRHMVVSIGKYMAKYNLTIPKELAEYE